MSDQLKTILLATWSSLPDLGRNPHRSHLSGRPESACRNKSTLSAWQRSGSCKVRSQLPHAVKDQLAFQANNTDYTTTGSLVAMEYRQAHGSLFIPFHQQFFNDTVFKGCELLRRQWLESPLFMDHGSHFIRSFGVQDKMASVQSNVRENWKQFAFHAKSGVKGGVNKVV